MAPLIRLTVWGKSPIGPKLKPPTMDQYLQCVQQANQLEAAMTAQAHAEEAFGGLTLLGGVAAIWYTWPMITDTIKEGIAEEPMGGLVEATHTQMAYGYTGSAALVPGFLYVQGIMTELNAVNQHANNTASCAGPVLIPW
jgi:hypothetical protein